MTRLSFILLGFVLLLAGCSDAPPQSNLPTTKMTIGQKVYTLEIAAKDDDRRNGLMYRDSIPADHGMIFLFTSVTERSFWMKNVRFPLDILFLDGAGKVVSIRHMQSYVTASTPSNAAAKYAIELNDGEAKSASVHEGDTLNLPAAIQNTVADPE
jgi:uncharacterized membrane protein (UPF0127 family)